MEVTKEFKVQAATIIGSEHLRRLTNNQDGLAIGQLTNQGKDYLWGVVCDGCSQGRHNEVGAILLSRYLAGEIANFIIAGLEAKEIPDRLFIAGLGYLRSLASSIAFQTGSNWHQERFDFIKHHLLCTVIGFIMDNELTVFFSAGDGVFIINKEVQRIDQANRPWYMGYHLLNKEAFTELRDILPLKFSIFTRATGNLEKFAICSDGLEEAIIDQLWGHQYPLSLTRRLRVLRAEKKAIFSDDCTIIAVERVKPEPGEEVIKDDNQCGG